RIPEYFGMALRQATEGQPGPVFLESPWDILGGEIDEEKAVKMENYRTTARPGGDPDMIKKAVELLLKAKRPLIVAGSGVWWSQASKELREFIEMFKVPLVLSQMSRGSVPEDHPYCFGPTRVGTRNADVVMLIGGRLTYALNFGRPGLFSYDQKWIQVDIEATEIGKNRPIDIGIVGDAKMVLQQMMDEGRDRTKNRKESDWIKECQAYLKGRVEKMDVFANSGETPIHPARLCKEIRDFVDRDATIIMDGGEITIWGGAILRVFEPGHWMDNGPTGCLGPGMGFAMAAKLARPNTQVLELTGDGTFGINGIEIETMVRHNIPAVSVIANDGAWTMIKKLQETQGPGRIIGTTLKAGTRYDKMAEALGAYAELVEKPEDIRPALQRAFASGKPAVLNVITKSCPRTPPTLNVGTTPGGDPLPFIL
ncbi:MAG: thiamine pyrophosphate-binding protein, partial [Dehalococcoidales bacterium]|nr:thiamine pyrophosphate-binding protein [Dehalococcoidales bacterium]